MLNCIRCSKWAKTSQTNYFLFNHPFHSAFLFLGHSVCLTLVYILNNSAKLIFRQPTGLWTRIRLSDLVLLKRILIVRKVRKHWSRLTEIDLCYIPSGFFHSCRPFSSNSNKIQTCRTFCSKDHHSELSNTFQNPAQTYRAPGLE